MKNEKKDGRKGTGGFVKISGYTGLYIREDLRGQITYYMTKCKSGFKRLGAQHEGMSVEDAAQLREKNIASTPPRLPSPISKTRISRVEYSIRTIGDMCRRYLAHHQNVNLTTAHVDEIVYRNHVEEPLSSEPLKKVTRPRMEYFLNTLTETSPKTKRRILAMLNRAYTYYIALGNNIQNPTKGIRIKVQNFRKDRILSREEINRMYAWCDILIREKPSYWYDVLELKAQITMGMEMGLRRSELWTDPGARKRFGTDRSLFWKDIDFKRNRVRLTRKGNTVHVMQLTPNVLKTLGHLVKNDPEDGDGRVFRVLHLTRFEMMIRDLGFNEGLDYHNPVDRERWVSFHTLRHTFGSIVLDQTKDLLVVSKLMNHSYQQTTLLYSHLLDNKEDMAMEMVGDYFK